MDVRFDSKAAMELIKQMDKYCSSIISDTKEITRIVSSSSGWDDNQRDAFEANLNSLKSDLNIALKMEIDYMKTYEQRVNELRG